MGREVLILRGAISGFCRSERWPQFGVVRSKSNCPELLGGQEFSHSRLGSEAQQIFRHLDVELVVADVSQRGYGLRVE